MKMRFAQGLVCAAIALFVSSAVFGQESKQVPQVSAQGAPPAGAPSAPAPVPASAPVVPVEDQLQSAFERVGSDVGPAVVSITADIVTKIPGQRGNLGAFRSGPFQDPMFNDFFKEFFGNTPDREFRQHGLGSGVVIDPQGFILTNQHVVENADKITVTLPDGRSFKAEVMGTDPRSDVAVLKLKASKLPIVNLGNSDEVKIGQWAIAIGNPFGNVVQSPKPTLTVGVISALNRSLPRTERRDRDYSDLIQTDAAINPGNSGGPLVNIRGEVIGINVAIFSTSGGYQGIGFAIPINHAKQIMEKLIAGQKVTYGWLGVSVQEVTQDLAGYLGLPDTAGALVTDILPDSPAQESGLKPSDVVRSFEGQKIQTVQELVKMTGAAEIGRRVKLGVFRDKKEITIEAKVGERPSGAEEEGAGEAGPRARKPWRGASVEPITPEVAGQLGLPDQKGVVVSEVDPNSPAAEAGMQPGDIIKEINRSKVDSLADYQRLIGKASGDVMIRTQRGYAVLKEKTAE